MINRSSTHPLAEETELGVAVAAVGGGRCQRDPKIEDKEGRKESRQHLWHTYRAERRLVVPLAPPPPPPLPLLALRTAPIAGTSSTLLCPEPVDPGAPASDCKDEGEVNNSRPLRTHLRLVGRVLPPHHHPVFCWPAGLCFVMVAIGFVAGGGGWFVRR